MCGLEEEARARGGRQRQGNLVWPLPSFPAPLPSLADRKPTPLLGSAFPQVPDGKPKVPKSSN